MEDIFAWITLIRRLALLEMQQPAPDGPPPDALFYNIRLEGAAPDAAPLHVLSRALSLGDFPVFCLMLAAASGFDPAFEEYYTALCGSRWPTLGLAVRLYHHICPVADEELAEVLDPQGSCRVVFSLEGEMPHMGARLKAAPGLHAALHGGIPPIAPGPGVVWFLPDGEPVPCANAAMAGQVADFVRASEEGGGQCAVVLSGPKGSGRAETLREVARHLHFPLAVVDTHRLAAMPAADAAAYYRNILLWCAAAGGRAALAGLTPQQPDDPAMGDFLSQCLRYTDTVFLTAEGGVPHWLPPGENLVEFPFPDENLLARRRFWQEAAAPYLLEDGLDVRDYANKLRYTAVDTRRILRRASLHALSRNHDAIGHEDILAGVRLHNAARPEGRSTSRVECVFTWDDIVLPEEPLRQLQDAAARIQHAHTVNDTWGFGRKLPYGRGVSILLYGPPGTGKTMSAQVIARALGLDLYKVDLSQLVSKYIGETEKNVADIFSFARRTNCVLLFDEADSLFSRRTEVKDANDRHANTETAFLLQKVEEHSGVCILSTNLLVNMDNAFRRRFTYIVGIQLPDAALRLKIWQKVFPPDAPLDPGLDFTGIAQRLELSASSIKAAAMGAAYLAAAAGESIGVRHLTAAVRAELQKQGTRLSEAEINQIWAQA